MAGITTRRLLVCAGGLALLGVLPARAQFDWNATQGTLFFDTPSNWNPIGTPNSDEDVNFFIDTAGNPIIIGASSATNGFNVSDNDWEFTGAAGGTIGTGTVLVNDAAGTSLANGANVLASNGLVWSSGSPAYVGTTGYGSMTFEGGSDLLIRQLFVGDGPSGVGGFTITGSGALARASLDSNTGVFTIGRGGGTGTINVLDGAELRTSSTGGNDIWVGGHLDDIPAGTPQPSTGTLNVDGVGSFVETEDLNVGIGGGIGFLNITNGGNVTLTDGSSPDAAFGANTGFNGQFSQGFGVVDGDGSLLSARSLFTGSSGLGTLRVSGGGEVRTRLDSSTPSDIFIGNQAGSAGKAAVYGFATDGTTPSLMDSEDNIYVGNEGLGQLNIGLDLTDNPVGSGALQVDASLFIGAGVGNNSDNKVLITGPDTTANVGANAIVGENGKGTLQILDGATVTIGNELSAGFLGGSTGAVLIDGAGTTLTAGNAFIGNGTGGGSAGSVTVSGGAVATFFEPASGTGPAVGAITLGDDGAGVGTLTVTGAGSLVETTNANGQWFVGGSGNETGGTGTANILAGGHGIAGGRTVIGHQPGAIGELNVDGAGSVFDADGDYILVGFEGFGELNVTDGATVNANRIFVADAVGSIGSRMNIEGAGSVVEVKQLLHVGDTARGSLDVMLGGRLKVATENAGARLIIGDESTSDGSRLTVDGIGSRVDYFGTADIAVGNAGGSTSSRALLEVLNGAVFSAVQRNPDLTIASQARLIIGDVDQGNGQVVVDGAGSRLEAEAVYVGDGNTASTGILDITNGGVAEVSSEFQAGANGNGQGTVNVHGAGSQLLVFGALALGDDIPGNGAATGAMTISDGGTVINLGQAYIGHYTGSFGSATLGSTTQDDSVWTIGGELTLAGTESSSQTSGSGSLTLNTGSVVNVGTNLRIRDLGDVLLTGGTLNVGNGLILTDAGSDIEWVFGTMRFMKADGYTFNATLLQRLLDAGGPNPTLFGGQHLVVDGAAVLGGPLRINGGSLSVGSILPANYAQHVDFDKGTLNLTQADLVVDDGGLLGENPTITELQTVNVTNSATVNAGSVFTIVGGFSSGGLTNKGDLVLIDTTGVGKTIGGSVHSPAGSSITLVGDITFGGGFSGAADFYGPGNAIFNALYAPGDSTAQIGFEGGAGFTPAGTLEIEIGGATPGTEHDQLVVAGEAQLAGVVDLVLIDGYTPSLGETYTVLTSGGLSGTTFDAVGGVTIGPGLGLAVTYTQTDVVVVAATPGDNDLDGDIDDADLGTSFANFTGPVALAGKAWVQGDTDGDGDVDDADLGTSFSGFTGPLGPGVSGVPEPASLLTLAGLLALASRRRR